MEFKWRTTGIPKIDTSKETKKAWGNKKYSVRVLVVESNEVRFARYSYEGKYWLVEGRMGCINVTKWSYIPEHD